MIKNQPKEKFWFQTIMKHLTIQTRIILFKFNPLFTHS